MSEPVRLRPPLRFAPSREVALVAGLVAALLAVTFVMARLGAPLYTPVSPQGIIDFELAGTKERAAEILGAWDARAREAARVQTRADDLVYIPVYVIALSVWAGAVAARVRPSWLARLGVALSWAMLAAGVFDLVENRQMMAQLEGGADAGRASLARTMAQLKFAIVYATMAYALIGTAVAWLQRRRPAE
ncbi:MAG TPA: hypothetical protein VHQ66_04290 [Myxococcota bacterium]|jgi:hypothetical protein|nr:hypothetical protein [Myxococcota bacterium]